MAKYLASQIYKGKLKYDDIIARYPNLKDEIDAELANLNQEV